MPVRAADHFTRWLSILDATVDSRFTGPSARRMKDLARRVAYSLQARLGIAPQDQVVSLD